MGGLLGFLVSSAAMAIAGTLVRGLLRPVGLGLFALAVLLMVSGRIRDTINPGSSGIVSTPSPDAPTAEAGWQTIANQLEPTIAQIPENGVTPSPSPPDRNLTAPVTPSSTPIPGFW